MLSSFKTSSGWFAFAVNQPLLPSAAAVTNLSSLITNPRQRRIKYGYITDNRRCAGGAEERLNEPFVTVNTVTGDLGIKQAQDDYQRLMNNKSPKNKRKYRIYHYLCTSIKTIIEHGQGYRDKVGSAYHW